MCHNDLHVVIDCPAVEGQPDVCDLVAQFIADLEATNKKSLTVDLTQTEDQ